MTMAPAVWYTEFEDLALFERSRAFAQQRGLLLWDCSTTQQIVISHAGRCCPPLARVFGWVLWPAGPPCTCSERPQAACAPALRFAGHAALKEFIRQDKAQASMGGTL